MLQFFKRNKTNIDSVIVPHESWTEEKRDASIINWLNADQTMAMTLNYFATKPDLPSVLNKAVLRDYLRNMIISNNGGLIEVDTVKIQGVNAVKAIFKVPQTPSGMTYLASYTIPFETCSYVVKLQVPEMGTTGTREALISNRMLAKNELVIGEEGMEGWMEDPYNPTFKGGTLMNKAEDPKYDADFPDHPLTIARKWLTEIALTIDFKPEVRKLKEYNY